MVGAWGAAERWSGAPPGAVRSVRWQRQLAVTPPSPSQRRYDAGAASSSGGAHVRGDAASFLAAAAALPLGGLVVPCAPPTARLPLRLPRCALDPVLREVPLGYASGDCASDANPAAGGPRGAAAALAPWASRPALGAVPRRAWELPLRPDVGDAEVMAALRAAARGAGLEPVAGGERWALLQVRAHKGGQGGGGHREVCGSAQRC